MYLIKYFKKRKGANSDFIFKYAANDGHLTSLFWVDAQLVLDYASFGDVVVFDSKYQLNWHNVIVIYFIGINHQGTIISALLLVRIRNHRNSKS